MLRVEEKGGTIKVHYDTIPDLMEYLDTFPAHRPGGRSVTSLATASWDFKAGWDGAVSLSMTGWRAGTADIMSKVKDIQNRDTTERGGFMWDVTGEILDVGAYCMGEPEHWLQPMEVESAPIFRICVNICCSCNVTADQFKNRGAAIIALVEKLQESGGIVELDVVMVDNGAKGSGGTEARRMGRVEAWHHFGASPLDVDMASFAIGHPAYFRRLMFGVIEVATKATGGCGIYGSVGDLKQIEAEQYDVYCPGGYSADGNGIREFNTIDGAADWVNRTAEKVIAKYTDNGR